MHANIFTNDNLLIMQLAGDTNISPTNIFMLYHICNIGQDLHQLLIDYVDKDYLKKARGLACHVAKMLGFLFRNNDLLGSLLELLFRFLVSGFQ